MALFKRWIELKWELIFKSMLKWLLKQLWFCYFMTNVVNNIIVIYCCYMCIYVYFLPDGDIVSIAQTVVCFNFDQRWINACNCCYDLTSLWFQEGTTWWVASRMFQPSEVTTTLNGERRLTWLLLMLRSTGLWTLDSRSNQQSQSGVKRWWCCLGEKEDGSCSSGDIIFHRKPKVTQSQ